MGRVLIRDLGRLGRAPKAWAILVGILIMPSLYAWVNIVAFWNPYGNTQHVSVAVANLDRGADSTLTGKLNVGDQVVAQLKQNHDLGWRFLGKDEALDAVRAGTSYAAIVIPENFTHQLVSLTTGHFSQPKVQYFVNEKANAIAPKITDVGASTLETQINSTFVSTVAETVAQDLRTAGKDTGDALNAADSSALSTLDQAEADIASARQGVGDIAASLSDTAAVVTKTKAALGAVHTANGEVQTAVSDLQSLVSDVQEQLSTLTNSITDAYVSGSAQLAEAAGKLNGTIAQLSTAAERANVNIGTAIDEATDVVTASGQALTALQAVLADLDPASPSYPAVSAAIDQLQSRIAADQQLLSGLTTLQTTTAGKVAAIEASANEINGAIQQSAGSASAIRQALTATVPVINRAIADMSASAGGLSSGLEAVDSLVEQSVNVLTGFQGQLVSLNAALNSLDDNFVGVQGDLRSVRTDVSALSGADIWKTVHTLTGLNAEQVAGFMSAPVQVNSHALFPVKTYGSGMAPLFVNLSLWIAAFMLVVLLKQEADAEGVDGLTVRQAYLGRFLLLAAINFIQALVVSVGAVVIGVHFTNPVVFVATSVFVGFVYLAIIYALATSFGYIGKGIAVLLVIMQIPGASGIYPIQMMPAFFQALYPFFPFTYGIAAMRETVGGFYDSFFLHAIAVLLLFAALAFVVGIFLRQRLGDYARLMNVSLARTHLFVTEDIQVLGSRRRLSQIVAVLADREAFRAKTRQRLHWLHSHHLTLTRASLLVGVVLTALLACIGWLFPDAKATVLGLWGLLCLLVMGFLVLLEYIGQDIGFARALGRMPEPELKRQLVSEESATHSSSTLAELEARDNPAKVVEPA